jgi:hypothetical protein
MARVLARRPAPVKRVVCTYCDVACEVAARAMSVFCPHCKKRLILEDFKIKSYHAVREFFTCGEVIIEKRGHVVAPIKAGLITIKGRVQGSVTSRGPATISKTGSLKGALSAPVLRIEQGAVLDGFLRIGDTNDKA